MNDPTALVLTISFVMAFVMIVLSILVRSNTSGKQVSSAPDGPSAPPELPVGKVPVWFYRPFELAGAAFIFFVFSGLFFLSMAGGTREVESLNPNTLIANIGFQFVIAGIVAMFAVRRAPVSLWLGLRWPMWKWVFLIGPGSVFLMWMIFGGLQISGYMDWMESLGVETVQDTVKLLQQSKDPLVLGLMAFAAVVAAPICEEIIFRGYFYPVMKKFAGAWPAAVGSALVFSAAHGNLTALLPLFIFGCLLVFIYEKTGSIWAPMSVHFCFNGATVIAQIAARYYHLPIDPNP